MFESLAACGSALLPGLLTRAECLEIRGFYERPELFRSRIDMKRYRFGQGEYQYFAYPLPERVAQLRRDLYAQLAEIANRWQTGGPEYPASHEEFLARCAEAQQLRPTPLLLRYREGDYNCLHQDLYGEVHFPFQVVIGLSAAGEEYSGGELVLVEQQPRAQSIARVVPLQQGDGAVIATRYRLGTNARGGTYRANVRHGVSALRSGERFTLGLIFHDAA
jgi:uncharacterized protein